MDTGVKCIRHGKVNELYCKKCNSFLCCECVSTHGQDGHVAEYVHVMKYGPEVALPLIDHLLKDISGKDSDMNLDAVEFVESLSVVVPQLKEIADKHFKSVQDLRTLTSQIGMFIGPLEKMSFAERAKKTMEQDRERLKKALDKKELEATINIARRMQEEEKSETDGSGRDREMLEQAQKAIASLADHDPFADLMKNLQMLMNKCQHLKLHQSNGEWRLDRKYLSRSMSLSENGLEYGNTAGSGYPAIIGDAPFEDGVYAFEVVATGLCCDSEGFGIVELEKYKSAFTSDQVTPFVSDNMLGLFHNGSVKNMTVVSGSTLTMGAKYTVKVDMSSLNMTIKGPSCHLQAKLSPEIVYVPCFALGCTANKLIIKPLDYVEEEQV